MSIFDDKYKAATGNSELPATYANSRKMVNQERQSAATYKFEPVKGHPMLHWKGRRPFDSTQYYPARLKDSYGKQVRGWMNKIFWGDNLQVMGHLLKDYKGQIDFIYIDPPYDSKADYRKKIKLRGREVVNNAISFEEKQYSDIWSNDEYLQFMYERLILIRELLSEKGSIILQCDWHKVHHLRCIMDEIFGPGNCINEIIWHYKTFQGQTRKYFARKHDNLLFYKKGEDFIYNKLYDTSLENTIDAVRWSDYIDENGKIYGNKMPLQDSRFIRYLNKWKREHKREPAADDVIYEVKGQPLDSVWHMKGLDPKSEEKLGYPTQKPVDLIERIILTTTNPGSIVFDCFMGSGTVQAVAMKTGRKFIGADINLGAVQTTTKRLLHIAAELKEKGVRETRYTGFQIYNVNHYDVFRNPLEAREIILKALEIKPFPNNNVYDGEKDGRMVRIMPINSIATNADLNELIANFDYKTFEKLKSKHPAKPVLRLLLICMGHEPGLAAYLQSAVPYKLDIEVIDILKDKTTLELKRDAEAAISIESGKLFIHAFYPINLLQKLSLQKENVDNWKELVDSVMIDYNYDGTVFKPKVIDIPERNHLVEGVYRMPAKAGTIHIKITDLLSEVFEQTVRNG
ncbi:site-specific DNA-methyltransferase [Chitinophaga sp. YR627]|uniref:site-specific DNA-methyltransferase n=1 Tax=Chitinophaga sp. YR627 TaxID=1881041 RepID=UPI002101CF89|nr:site-specific DNA-methyltransferase [Chitinophaga sp. YR627]